MKFPSKARIKDLIFHYKISFLLWKYDLERARKIKKHCHNHCHNYGLCSIGKSQGKKIIYDLKYAKCKICGNLLFMCNEDRAKYEKHTRIDKEQWNQYFNTITKLDKMDLIKIENGKTKTKAKE